MTKRQRYARIHNYELIDRFVKQSAKNMETIKYNNLCTIGKYLSSISLTMFIEHITNCKKCKTKGGK